MVDASGLPRNFTSTRAGYTHSASRFLSFSKAPRTFRGRSAVAIFFGLGTLILSGWCHVIPGAVRAAAAAVDYYCCSTAVHGCGPVGGYMSG